jgi:cytoskeletal protein CcmA (bactofilin family)
MLMRTPSEVSPDRLGTADPSIDRAVQSTMAAPLENTQRDGVVFIGKGSKFVGDLSDCTMAEIQGSLEGTIVANAVVIQQGGVFKGTMVTDQVEVHGVVEGTVTVHDLLDMRSSGIVSGDLTYGRLAVADGGHIFGTVKRHQPVAESSVEAGNVVSLNNAALHDDGSAVRWQT